MEDTFKKKAKSKEKTINNEITNNQVGKLIDFHRNFIISRMSGVGQ